MTDFQPLLDAIDQRESALDRLARHLSPSSEAARLERLEALAAERRAMLADLSAHLGTAPKE